MRSIIFMILTCAVCGFRTSSDLKADYVLKRMADKLNTIKTLRYQYNREISYPSENYIDDILKREEAVASSH